MTTKRSNERAKPRIILTATDYERLSRLSLAASSTMPDIAFCLADELDRARVLPAGQPADGVVCMGSEVAFREETTGQVQPVTLVYPDEADIAKGKVSVLTPIGIALIGLAVGTSIAWATRTGEERRLTVLQIREPQSAEPKASEPQTA